MTSGCPRRPYWNTWIPRTEGKVLLLIFKSVRWLVDKLPDPPSSLSSGCCGGPEWAERIAFNSKPIRMHFCCTPPPPALPFPHLVASPVRMMSLTAVNTVSMETPTTALAYISGSSPSILQHHHRPPPSHPTLSVPSLPPSLLTPHLMRTDERWVEALVGGLTAVDRKSVMVRKKKL